MVALRFEVLVDLAHVNGPFVSKADLGEQVAEALGSADPGTVDVENSSYDVVTWEVNE